MNYDRAIVAVLSNTSLLRLTTAAGIQMQERNIHMADIKAILRKGTITEGPAINPDGYWEAKHRWHSGTRSLGITTVMTNIEPGNMIIVRAARILDWS